MSEEKIKALLEQEAFVTALLSCEEAEDAQKLFKDNGVELSMEEITALGKALQQVSDPEGEMDEEALADVAGGASIFDWRKILLPVISPIIKPGIPRLPGRPGWGKTKPW